MIKSAITQIITVLFVKRCLEDKAITRLLLKRPLQRLTLTTRMCSVILRVVTSLPLKNSFLMVSAPISTGALWQESRRHHRTMTLRLSQRSPACVTTDTSALSFSRATPTNRPVFKSCSSTASSWPARTMKHLLKNGLVERRSKSTLSFMLSIIKMAICSPICSE